MHGSATCVQIAASNNALEITDDGQEFDPLTLSKTGHASPNRNVGSAVLRALLKIYDGFIQPSHTRREINGKLWNATAFNFRGNPLEIGTPLSTEVLVDLAGAHGRRGASRLAQSISVASGTRELVLVFSQVPNFSGFTEIICQMLAKIPGHVSITISINKTDFEFFREFPIDFGERVKIIPR